MRAQPHLLCSHYGGVDPDKNNIIMAMAHHKPEMANRCFYKIPKNTDRMHKNYNAELWQMRDTCIDFMRYDSPAAESSWADWDYWNTT